jgi:inhibitor of KinA
VYPLDTPGGWHIIGRTDETMFDPERNPPALLRAGDIVRFVPSP